jgi:ribonuclease Y
MTTAVQRYARSHISEITTSTVNLPSDELKGRIIGKEGRNIRTLERLTGVEVIVDETPEAITLSSFDPLRREIAKTALLKLMADGRIQPARIEEKVEEAKKEVSNKVLEAGEAALYEVGILDLPKEVTMLLGRLAFRTSYGQNVLLHSIEMAHIANMLARELGANAEVAKKAALLHDIGKAVDHEIEGTHLELGRKILQKYGIDQAIVKAMESHHEDYPFSTPESLIVAAADVISSARPGARRDTVENYIKRLTELENIVNSFAGVEKSYAISAGREIRIFVQPEKIDDLRALQLAKEMAKRIESELKYPGEIKVNVIRETRAVEYAR